MLEFKFDEGLPQRPLLAEPEPDEYLHRRCGECIRCEEREDGFRCIGRPSGTRIRPGDNACERFWSKDAQAKLDEQHQKDIDTRREELWAINENKPAVKLPIVFDGYGNVPMCPTCGEMPYSTEQCYWCGQHFTQDEEIAEYNAPEPEVRLDCLMCGGHNTMVGSRSRYNNHFHGQCEKCGCVMME